MDSSTVTNRFTIRDTVSGFVDWANSYGFAHNRVFVKYGAGYEAGIPDGCLMYYHAAIYFVIRVDAPERLIITAWLENDDALEYYQALAVAIRREYTDVAGLTDLERFYLKAVRERPKERGRLDDYCARVGVSDQTLRNYRKRFIEMGLEVD